MCHLVEQFRTTYNTKKYITERKAAIFILASEEKKNSFLFSIRG